MSTTTKNRDDWVSNGGNILLTPSNSVQQSSPASSTTSISTLGQSVQPQQLMDDVQAILKGTFVHKCQMTQKLRQIRIFLCSTQSDFEEERDCFWFEILPELQQHCSQYGADILLFDTYQGSDFDPVYQPQLLNLLFQQVHDCRRQSEGVFFVCLIGDKYGSCPLPSQLRSEEFQHIRTAAFEAGKDVRPLDDWYKLDQNAIPATHVLQPSSSKKKLDAKTFYDLQEVIQLGAHTAHQEGLINQVNRKCQERFFTSSVEMAVEHALSAVSPSAADGFSLATLPTCTAATNAFSWSSPALKGNSTRCLFIFRKFEGIQHNVASSLATYVDTTSHTYWNPHERLVNLKNSVSNAVDKSNLETFRVNWEAGDAQTWLRSKDREKYLSNFSQRLIYKLKSLIDRTFGSPTHKANRRGSQCNIQSNIFKGNGGLKNTFETIWLHHHHTLASRPSKFVGRTDILKKIRDTCKEATRRPASPLIIQSEDGSGRTAMLTEIAYQAASNWLIGATVICRYVQLNVQSQYVHELIRSMCLQLCYAHQLDDLLNAYREFYSADKMAEWLETACSEAVRKSGQPVVILVDDIHQVKYGPHLGGKGQQNFSWLPSPLPLNVVVIGTISTSFPLEQLPIKRWDTSKGLIKLPNLTELELMEICKNFLASLQRSVNLDQEGLLKNAFKASPSPVFAKLLAYEAAQWSSFQQVQSLTNNGGKSGGLATSSLAAYLDQKFSQLEKQFGYDVCQQICCYLECAHNGLTETELIDLLSCHRELMNKIYPEQGSVRLRRFPSNLWTRFKNELGPLLVFKAADFKAVLKWSQSPIGNFVRHRYLNSSSQLKKCHMDLADLFSNSWGNAEHVDAANSSTEGKVVHKFVMPQPLRLNSESAAAASGEDGPVYNLRRVQSLWYHLLHSGSVDYFEEQSLCNFEYLEALLRATSLAHLLAVMDHALSQILNYNLHVLYGVVLRSSLYALSHDQTLFAAELIGRLRYTRGRNTAILNNLVEQAMAWVDNYSTTPLIVPLTCWIKPPLCPLVVTFKLQDWVSAQGAWTIVQPTLNYQHLLATGNKNSTLILMYHIASHTLVKTFAGHQDKVIWLEMSKNGQLFASSSADGTVRVWDLHQGTCLRNFSPHTDRAYAVAFTHDDQYLVTCGADQTAKITCMETGRILRCFEGHTAAVTTLALTSADDYLITGSSDFTVFVWDMETGVKVTEISGLMAPVRCIHLTSNDAFLMVASEDETLKVYSLCLGNEIHELRGHEGKICSLAVAIDDCQVFAGSTDGKVYCYDIHTGQLLLTQNCHSSAVSSLKVTSDGHFLVSGCAENVHVWNIDRSSDHQKRQEDGNHLTAVALSKDLKYGASGNFAGLVYLWDLEVCHCLWVTRDEPPSPISCLQFDPDTNVLFSGSTMGVVSIWSMADGSPLKKYDNHSTPIRTIQIFSDRSRVLTHEASGIARVWQLNMLKQPQMLFSGSGASGEVEENDRDGIVEMLTLKGCGDTIRLSSDKDVIAKTADADKEMRIWNIAMEDENGITLRAKLCHTDPITCLAMNAHSKLLVTGSADQSLKVWEGTTGYLTQVLVGHSDTIVCCAINDMCTVVVSAAADNSMFSWDIDTGTILAAFNTHKKPITSVFLTPDGNVAVSGSKDGWMYAWTTEGGQQISSFNAQLPIAEILSTPDGHRILVRLEQCPHLAILCLHNCPTFLEPITAKKRNQSRTMSVSSIASTGSLSSAGSARDQQAPTNAGPIVAGATAQSIAKDPVSMGGGHALKKGERNSLDKPSRADRKQSKVFAQLERSRSRASLYDTPTSTRLGAERASKEKANKQNAANSSSKVCTIL